METYDPEYVSNTSDKAGQYAFAQQPEARGNAEARRGAQPGGAMPQPHLDRFDDLYFAAFSQRMLCSARRPRLTTTRCCKIYSR